MFDENVFEVKIDLIKKKFQFIGKILAKIVLA